MRVWLSYDLTVKGDYENLYIWLDEKNAKECGDSVATFLYEPISEENIKNEIKNSIESAVTINKNDRIYLIYKKSNGKYSGSFIFGHRKSNPWEGLSRRNNGSDDE